MTVESQELTAAIASFEAGKFQETVTIARGGTQRYSDDGRLWEIMGRALGALRQDCEAIDALENAMSFAPLGFHSRLMLVICYARIGREMSARVEAEFLTPQEGVLAS